uniref:Protein phosphatase 1 regulatory subunit 32 n=1 Tax=Lepisosteus oculatus TaxID=7918 RepID=W5LWK9_LEPOC|nr:PREDICTED: protein phosphatase 1 regulatory subunit 32 isoform X1 [Lepisosteus oculatus]XP_015195417.1 PREDICTED: protein phosphatase 1 regulatory subunit 32 isoform X1 [Lepisosteus oculatus]
MMARVAVGRPCPRVLASVGADVNPLSFYSTSYSASYGTGRFVPRPGRHSGTGYAANLRPVLHYQPSLDRTDNPPLGLSLLDSLQSVTHRHFLPLCRPDGSEPLPQIRGKRESAYLRDTAVERGGKMLHQSEYQGHFVPLATGPAGPGRILILH